jgi:hypothetical protein
MPSPDLSGLFKVGLDVLTTTVNRTTKKILAQLGDVHKQTTDTDNAEWWQHIGFASRPPKPEAGKRAAQTTSFCAGDHDVVFASQDLRGLELYGQLDHGETCVYAPGLDGLAQARVILKKNGSLHLFTKTGNTDSGKGMGVSVNSDGSISVAGDGNAVLIGSDGSVKIFNASGGIQVTADGSVKLASGAKVEISGASITMGGPTALPVAIGPNVVTAITALQAQITALQTEIAATAAALVACMNIPGPILPPHGAAAAAATTAVGAAATIVISQTVATSAASAIVPALRTSAD